MSHLTRQSGYAKPPGKGGNSLWHCRIVLQPQLSTTSGGCCGCSSRRAAFAGAVQTAFRLGVRFSQLSSFDISLNTLGQAQPGQNEFPRLYRHLAAGHLLPWSAGSTKQAQLPFEIVAYSCIFYVPKLTWSGGQSLNRCGRKLGGNGIANFERTATF